MSKRFTFEKMMDILLPLFMVEVFLLANIAIIAVLLDTVGVI
jgi:hypothetical protein